MPQVFISHVEEDAAVAEQLAAALEAVGYVTWYYERDSLPGPSYLSQIVQALERTDVVILLISPDALRSWQVDKEVIQAHETGKPFLPLLHGLSHADLRGSRPDWAMALGAATSLAVPAGGIAPVMPRLLEGLHHLEAAGRGPLLPERRALGGWWGGLRRLAQHRAAAPVLFVIGLLLVALAFLALRHAPTPADAARPACCGARYFPPTHHNLSGAFLAFWVRYGGLDIFGYPRTEPFREHGRLEQYTDRFLLEEVRGRVVTAPLGRLLTTGRHFDRVGPFRADANHLYFPATGHSLTERFLRYWRSHHGALLLGAPIAEVSMEANQDGTGRQYQVQWFENGRMEYHPELMNSRYQVELGLTGREALHRLGWLP